MCSTDVAASAAPHLATAKEAAAVMSIRLFRSEGKNYALLAAAAATTIHALHTPGVNELIERMKELNERAM